MMLKKGAKMKKPTLICDTNKKRSSITMKMLEENSIDYDLIPVIEDKYKWPFISFNGLQWIGMDGVEAFIKYYNKICLNERKAISVIQRLKL